MNKSRSVKGGLSASKVFGKSAAANYFAPSPHHKTTSEAVPNSDAPASEFGIKSGVQLNTKP